MKLPSEIKANLKSLEGRLSRKIQLDEREIETLFSDSEAISICGGMKNSNARRIWKNYHLNKETKADKFAAHEHAMNLVKEVGRLTVSFLMALPPLPMRTKGTSKAFVLFDRIKENKQRPCFRLVDRTGTKYSVSFYYSEIIRKVPTVYETKAGNIVSNRTEIKEVKERTYDYNQLIIQSDDIPLTKIYRNGSICPVNDATTNRPVIELLIRFFENPQQEFIYYGTEMGRCSNCDKVIFVERSVAAAVGPICAKNLGLPY